MDVSAAPPALGRRFTAPADALLGLGAPEGASDTLAECAGGMPGEWARRARLTNAWSMHAARLILKPWVQDLVAGVVGGDPTPPGAGQAKKKDRPKGGQARGRSCG